MKIFTFIITFTLISTFLHAQNAGQTLDFDGSNDYINCDTSYKFHPKYLTVVAWINADTWRTNNWQGTILSTDSWTSPNGQRGWVLRTGDNGRLTLLCANASSGAWMECMSAQIMSTGKWYHVAGIFDGTTQKVYINGVLVQTLSNTAGIRYNGMDKMIIGDCTGQLANRDFDGKIDEVRLWNIAVDTATLKLWMNKPLNSNHPNSSNLVAYYKLNEGTGTTTYDSSGNGFNGSLVNFSASPWTVSYAPIASHPSDFLNDVAAVWSAKSNGTSSSFRINDALSGNNYIVFGHNGNSLNYIFTNKPSYIQKRLTRIWRIEKEGSATGDLIFNYNNIDTSGFYTFRLLVSSDTNFTNATVITGTKIGNTKIAFNNVVFQDSFFYTIGTYDYQGPTVATYQIEEVKAFSAKVKGKVIDDGGLLTTRGICYSTSANPDITNSFVTTGTGNGIYTSALSNLSQNTTYHVRAFAYNTKDTVYGADSSFTTPIPSLASVSTDGYLVIYTDSALVSGTVINDGNMAVTEKGFCWSTNPNPTANLSTKIAKGMGIGNFIGTLPNLQPNTTYHFRAYAVNAIDTAYGGDSIFTTLSISVPTVSTGTITNITGYSAKISGNCSFDGRRNVTEKGIVYGTTSNPTINLSTKSYAGPGIGSFTSSFSNLQPNTTYHARAYATNAVGTGYGNDTVFLTAAQPDVVITGIAPVSYYSATVKINVVNDGRMPVSSRGICYGKTPNPDFSNTKVPLGNGTGTATANLSGLPPGTTYYVRAYAINAVDTSFSVDSIFKTLTTYPPTVTTKTVTNILASKANCGGIVVSDGGASVTERGVCWAITPNPKANISTKIIVGSGTGAFNAPVSNLQYGTTYHVRAYAINNVDTAYGGDSVFTTLGKPTVTTDNVSGIAPGTANCGGNVTQDGGSFVVQRGVCWSTNPSPTARLGTKTTNGFGLGTFTSKLTGLLSNKTYYVRAFAINSVDTAYGNEVSFMTPSAPEVLTVSISDVTGFSAKVNGNVTKGTNVTDRGIIWSKYPNPSVGLTTKTNEGSGLGTFSSNISGLEANTLYHVRAYAINSAGTSYGADSTFTTATIPDLTTNDVVIDSKNSATCGGNISFSGRMPVVSRGVCWSETKDPMASLATKTIDGNGIGSFISKITGLKSNTVYYVRAYAINEVDTAYGDEKSFEITPPVAITGSASNISLNSAELSGTVNAKGQSTNIYFEYGLTTAYGSTIGADPAYLNTSVNEQVTGSIISLNNKSLYHYRVVAESVHGISYGDDDTFSTLTNSLAEEELDSWINIWANNGEITVKAKKPDNNLFEIKVIDMLGHLVFSKQANSEIKFPIKITSAYYIVKVIDGDKTFIQKVWVD